MAEHLNQPAEEKLNPFNNMGKPIPPLARQVGFDTCKEMGLDSASAWAATNAVAEQLERDKPYEAQHAAMRHLDLTGAYRLMAALLAAVKQAQKDLPSNA